MFVSSINLDTYYIFISNFLVPSKIDRQGVNIHPKVVVNSSLVISCPATGVPTPNITWLKDGQPVEFRAGVIETRQSGTELVLYRAQVADSGRYRCVASNPAGDDNLNFHLDVQGELNFYYVYDATVDLIRL